jgi:CHAT domain-containing protein
VQARLGANEALVLFLDTPNTRPLPEETFIWVVTRTDFRWVRSTLGTAGLIREVAALRCGLDYEQTWNAAPARCAELTKTNYTAYDRADGKPLPFDLARAHALYEALFGQVEDLIKGKQLLIVPSGALTQLPFQVLVTETPDPAVSGGDAFRRAAWLIRDHALTVLPSVSSLKDLRDFAKTSTASRPLIGFGNPLLDGPSAQYKQRADEAQTKQTCANASEHSAAALSNPGDAQSPNSRALVNVAQIRAQIPLPETADELCSVARDLGGGDILLGARATEAEVKRLSAIGELAKYRVIQFATHGALAGQINPQPGLVLTPPAQASDLDDGYLSALEIAALKLDADWVILSACNTAAAGAGEADALSGLARAFFYAGARSLLVSHWAVASNAAVTLVTKAVAELKSDPKIGRAEALRRSMLWLINDGKGYEAYPAYWAPFVVVGAGGATL